MVICVSVIPLFRCDHSNVDWSGCLGDNPIVLGVIFSNLDLSGMGIVAHISVNPIVLGVIF